MFTGFVGPTLRRLYLIRREIKRDHTLGNFNFRFAVFGRTAFLLVYFSYRFLLWLRMWEEELRSNRGLHPRRPCNRHEACFARRARRSW